MRWSVVIPIKSLPAAKSRLAPATPDPAAHRRLVEAIRADTVAATLAAGEVARVLLVLDRSGAPAAGTVPAASQPAGTSRTTDGAPGSDVPPGVLVLVQRQPGLNTALAEAAEHAARQWPGEGVAALVGDLPALRPEELDAALRAAAGHLHAFVPDSTGTGTTLLTAAAGQVLRPAFGIDSALRHASAAAPLPAGPGLRHDVDTAEDLDLARALGLGAATEHVVALESPALCSPSGGIVDP